MIGLLSAILLVVLGLLAGTAVFQFVRNYRVVGANEVAVIAGRGPNGYSVYQGGRVIVWPLLNARYNLDLRPRTVRVESDRAIASGMVPLRVVATMTFAVSTEQRVLDNAVKRLASFAAGDGDLEGTVRDIVEGHLRDAISTMTPEGVMRDKDALVKRIFTDCRRDLESIGIDIHTINVSDVADNRLPDMDNEALYIELLNEVESTNAQAQARVSRAQAAAQTAEKQANNRAEVEENKYKQWQESLVSNTEAKLAEKARERDTQIEEINNSGHAEQQGLEQQIEAEKARYSEVTQDLQARIITPAYAERDETKANALRNAEELKAGDASRLAKLGDLAAKLQEGGDPAIRAYVMSRSHQLTQAMGRTLSLLPANRASSVLDQGNRSPLSVNDPNPVSQEVVTKAASIVSESSTAEENATAD